MNYSLWRQLICLASVDFHFTIAHQQLLDDTSHGYGCSFYRLIFAARLVLLKQVRSPAMRPFQQLAIDKKQLAIKFASVTARSI